MTAPNVDVSSISNSATLSEKLINELPVIVTGTKRDITSLLPNLPGFTGGTTFDPARERRQRRRHRSVRRRRPVEPVHPARRACRSWPLDRAGRRIQRRQSNGFNAEYGGVGIWFSNVTIKSGTNRFSGQRVRSLRHTTPLNAKSFFQAAKERLQATRGWLHPGGPVMLPNTTAAAGRSSSAALALFFSRSRAGRGADHGADRAVSRRRLQRLAAPGRRSHLRSGDDPTGRERRVRARSVPRQHHSRRPHQPRGQPDSGSIPSRRTWRASSTTFAITRLPTWPSFDTYTPIVKVDHNLTRRSGCR